MQNISKLKFGIFSKLLIIILSLFYLSTYINRNFNLIYANIPLFSIYQFEIYRIITGIFISENNFDFILNCISVITIINYYENKEGTIKTAINLISNAVVFEIFIMILSFILYYILPIVISFTIKPMICLFISYLTKHILLTDDNILNIYPNIKFNNRFFILSIFISNIIYNLPQFKFEYCFALYFGFLICKFPKYLQNSMNEEDILHFEKNENFKFFFNLHGWVLIEECFFKSESFSNTNQIRGDNGNIPNSESSESLDDFSDPNLIEKKECNDDCTFDLS